MTREERGLRWGDSARAWHLCSLGLTLSRGCPVFVSHLGGPHRPQGAAEGLAGGGQGTRGASRVTPPPPTTLDVIESQALSLPPLRAPRAEDLSVKPRARPGRLPPARRGVAVWMGTRLRGMSPLVKAGVVG